MAAIMFVVSIMVFLHDRGSKKNTGYETTMGQKDVLHLDRLDDDLKDDVGGQSGNSVSLTPRLMGSISLCVLFAVLQVLTLESQVHHNMAISFEEFAVSSLAEHLSDYFVKSGKDQVRTIVVVNDIDSAHDSGLVERFQAGAASDWFYIAAVYSLREHASGNVDPALSMAELQALLATYPKIDLVVSLAGFTLAGKRSLFVGARPYIAVLSDDAEFNQCVDLVNLGMIDVAVVSRGNYIHHGMIPRDQPPESIFGEHFILITASNVRDVVGRYRQTVSLLPGKSNE